jgi:hypothetical protein
LKDIQIKEGIQEYDYFDHDFKDVSKHPVMSSLLKETQLKIRAYKADS